MVSTVSFSHPIDVDYESDKFDSGFLGRMFPQLSPIDEVHQMGEIFEYYVEMNAGEKDLFYPATAKDINFSVLVLK